MEHTEKNLTNAGDPSMRVHTQRVQRTKFYNKMEKIKLASKISRYIQIDMFKQIMKNVFKSIQHNVQFATPLVLPSPSITSSLTLVNSTSKWE
jgi:6-phosphogluconate dehydrogenase